MKSVLISCLLLLLLPPVTQACTEYKIVDHGDHVEAVCVGEPLTDKEKEQLEKQQELERNTSESENTRYTGNELHGAPAKAGAVSETTTFQNENVDNSVQVIFYDVKYISSGRIINGREKPGEYSVKIEAKNNGKSATIKFKLKQVDNAGYETESLTMSERFGIDERKTITTHMSAHQVPFIQDKEWVIEATKY